jgi:hypothetical protein
LRVKSEERMEIRARGLASLIGSVALGFALPAFGLQSVNLTLNNTNGDPIVTVGGATVYAGVYGGTSTLSGSNPGIICDDFNDEVTVGQIWTAEAYQVSTLSATVTGIVPGVLFGGGTSGYLNVGIAGYAAIAYLVELSFRSAGNPTLQGEISEAIWSISEPGLSGTGPTTAAYSLVQQAESYAALTGDSLSQYTNLVIYTPTSPFGSTGRPQEMWGTVPEGGAAFMFLLMAGASCFGGMFFKYRSQVVNRETA